MSQRHVTHSTGATAKEVSDLSLRGQKAHTTEGNTMKKKEALLASLAAIAIAGTSLVAGASSAQAYELSSVEYPYMERTGSNTMTVHFTSRPAYGVSGLNHKVTCQSKTLGWLFPKVSGQSTTSPVTVNGLKRLLNYKCSIQTFDPNGNSSASQEVKEGLYDALVPNVASAGAYPYRYAPINAYPTSASPYVAVIILNNYDSEWDWSATSSAGNTVEIRNTGSANTLAIVPNITPGESDTITIEAKRPGFKTGSAKATISMPLVQGDPIGLNFREESVAVDQQGKYSADYAISFPRLDSHLSTVEAKVTEGSANIAVKGNYINLSGMDFNACVTFVVTQKRKGWHPTEATAQHCVKDRLKSPVEPVLSDFTPYSVKQDERGLVSSARVLSNTDPSTKYTAEILSGQGTISMSGIAFRTENIQIHGMAPGSCVTFRITGKRLLHRDFVRDAEFCVASSLRVPAASLVENSVSLDSAGTAKADYLVEGAHGAIYNVDVLKGTADARMSQKTPYSAGETLTVQLRNIKLGECVTFRIRVSYPSDRPSENTFEHCNLKSGFEFAPSTGKSLTFTQDGFTTQIPNFDPAFDYVATATRGSVLVQDGKIIVSELTPGTSSEITVQAFRDGYKTTSISFAGMTPIRTDAPILSQSVITIPNSESEASGMVELRIENYMENTIYTISSNVGDVIREGDLVRVSGLSSGDTLNLSISAKYNSPYFTESSAAIFEAFLGSMPLAG